MKKVLRWGVIYLFVLLCTAPVAVVFLRSFRGAEGGLSAVSYLQALFRTEDFYRAYWNSVAYTVLIILFNIPISVLTAYGFFRFRFSGKNGAFRLYIILMLMPFQATIVPQYLTLKALGLIEQPLAVILPNIFATFGTILMIQQMKGLDRSLFDAAEMDGFSEFQMMTRIALPTVKPLVFALTTLSFINYWSMVEQPLIFLSEPSHLPLSMILNSSSRFRQVAYSLGVLFSVLPLLIYQATYDDLVYGIGLSSNVSVRQSGKEKKKYRARRRILGFLVFMAVSNFFSEKILYSERAKVEVSHPVSGALGENPYDKEDVSLGYFASVLPTSAVHEDRGEYCVYLVVAEKSKLRRAQIVKYKVSKLAENKEEVAVYGLNREDWVVIRSDRMLRESDFVRVYYDE